MNTPTDARLDLARRWLSEELRFGDFTLAPERLAAMVQAWEAWEATMPPIPADATVSLGYGVKDMPQR